MTGTYEQRLFEDYVAQESADMRPDIPSVEDVEEIVDAQDATEENTVEEEQK